ncbi:LAETG motif-containing sortase-dependent surface protein [Streptomyces sp. NPDC004111]|uniref:LAETG motif-containing sortase-dependent surface protein n=1 Tax=Streptomyces sp. NPDC004111 TaxID=3364690 RepID=UPI0036AC0D24
MKLRRSLALAAATAVIAPVSLFSASAAYATTSPSPSASVSTTPSGTPSAPETPSTSPETTPSTPSTPSKSPETTPSGTPSASATPTPTKTPSATPSRTPSGTPSPTDPDEELPGECQDVSIGLTISGLSGKIAAGSGWHPFNLNVHNTSDRTLNGVAVFAGAAADKDGSNLFTTKQVQLQAYDETSKSWQPVSLDDLAAGYVGETDTLEPDFEIDIKLRLNVAAGAPVGAGFTLGGGVYVDVDKGCIGTGETAYKFQIVKSGTDTSGTKPQEGGKTPLPVGKPAPGKVPAVTGNLAETGASSQMPVIGLAGGAAVVLGAGALFLVRRRKADA